MNKKVNELITEITSLFEGTFENLYEHLLCEYNKIVRSLLLMLPFSDSKITLTAVDGKIETELLPCQVKRVFYGESELLRATMELVTLLPDAKLYHAAEDGIYVTVDGECTVFYRDIPKPLTSGDALTEVVPCDAAFALIVRTYLERCAYFYIGDYDSADACAAEYNRCLEDYKLKNGVAV